MRIVLAAWEWDEDGALAQARALAGLGAEVVGFGRTEAGLPDREERGGWRLERCPYEIASDPLIEVRSFAESATARAQESGLQEGGFDIAHALDPKARAAALALAERSPLALKVASALMDSDFEAFLPPGSSFDQWICDHPWTAERWGDQARPRQGVKVVVPGRAIAPRSGFVSSTAGSSPTPTPSSPLIGIWLPRERSADPGLITEAIRLFSRDRGQVWESDQVSDQGPGAAIFGWGASARALRNRLALLGGVHLEPTSSALSASEWNSAMDRVIALGVLGNPSEEPMAWMAWLRGAAVFSLERSTPAALAEAIRDAANSASAGPRRREREVRVGAEVARGAIEPAAVARGWMRSYLRGLSRSALEDETAGPRRLIWTGGRTRLSLTPLDPRRMEAIWRVHPDDLRIGLAWMGAEATRSSLTIRLLDVTDIPFRGDNAHGAIDFDIRAEESRRILSVDLAGRSYAGCLGLKTGLGAFQLLAYADLIHLPKEHPASHPAARRLRALSRSARGLLD